MDFQRALRESAVRAALKEITEAFLRAGIEPTAQEIKGPILDLILAGIHRDARHLPEPARKPKANSGVFLIAKA